MAGLLTMAGLEVEEETETHGSPVLRYSRPATMWPSESSMYMYMSSGTASM